MNLRKADLYKLQHPQSIKIVENFSEQSQKVIKKYSKDQNEQKINNNIPRSCFSKSKKLQYPEQLPQVGQQDKTINVRSKPRIKSFQKNSLNKYLSECRKKVQRSAQTYEKSIKKQFERKLSKSKEKRRVQLYHLKQLQKIENSSKIDFEISPFKKIPSPTKSREIMKKQNITTNRLINQTQYNNRSNPQRLNYFDNNQLNNPSSQRIQERDRNREGGLSINMRISDQEQCYLGSLYTGLTSNLINPSKKILINVSFGQSQTVNQIRWNNVRGSNAQQLPHSRARSTKKKQNSQFKNSEINQDFQSLGIHPGRNEYRNDNRTQKGFQYQEQKNVQDRTFSNKQEYKMQSFNSMSTLNCKSFNSSVAKFNNKLRDYNQSSNAQRSHNTNNLLDDFNRSNNGWEDLSQLVDLMSRPNEKNKDRSTNKFKNKQNYQIMPLSQVISDIVQSGHKACDKFDNERKNQDQSQSFKQGRSQNDQKKHNKTSRVQSSKQTSQQSQFKADYQPLNFPDSRLTQPKSIILKDEEYQYKKGRNNLRKQHVDSEEGIFSY